MKTRSLLQCAVFVMMSVVVSATTRAASPQSAGSRQEVARLQQENALLQQQLARQKRKTARLQQINAQMLQSTLATERELQSIWKSLRVRYKAWNELSRQNEPLHTQQQQRDRDLIAAIKRMDAAAVVTLLEQGAHPNTHDLEGYKAYPTEFQNPSALALFLNDLAPIPDTSSPAHDPIAAALIAHEADFYSVPPHYISALESATHFGLSRTTRLLLALGADPNAKVFYSHSTPLMFADEMSTRLLLWHGADLHAKDEPHKYTALHCACVGGREVVGTVRLLLEAGADPNARTSYGETPLMMNHSPENAALLLEYGADIHAKDNYGRGVLFNVQHYRNETPREPSEYKDLVPFLKKHGATEKRP